MRLTVNPFFTVSRIDGWKIRSLPSFYDREVFISWLEENKERRLEGLTPQRKNSYSESSLKKISNSKSS